MNHFKRAVEDNPTSHPIGRRLTVPIMLGLGIVQQRQLESDPQQRQLESDPQQHHPPLPILEHPRQPTWFRIVVEN
jgi:hypothetical protein